MVLSRKKRAQQYKQIGVSSVVTEANPHRLVQILFENMISGLNEVKGAINHGEVKVKAQAVSKCLKIIETLRGSLNFEKGGELSQNLASLYDYMMQRLLHANLHDDVEAIEESLSLIRTIKDGWDQIPRVMADSNHSS